MHSGRQIPVHCKIILTHPKIQNYSPMLRSTAGEIQPPFSRDFQAKSEQSLSQEIIEEMH